MKKLLFYLACIIFFVGLILSSSSCEKPSTNHDCDIDQTGQVVVVNSHKVNYKVQVNGADLVRYEIRLLTPGQRTRYDVLTGDAFVLSVTEEEYNNTDGNCWHSEHINIDKCKSFENYIPEYIPPKK
jgi:hypothetical protein